MDKEKLDTVSRSLYMLNLVYQVSARAYGQGEGFGMAKAYVSNANHREAIDRHIGTSNRLGLRYKSLALVTHDRMLNNEDNRI